MSPFPRKILFRFISPALAGMSLLFVLSQSSCSQKPSTDATPAAGAQTAPVQTPPAPAAVAPAVPAEKNPGASRSEQPTPKGIGGTAEVAAPKPESVVPPYHNVFVLSVGINSSPAYPKLQYAVDDAGAIAQVCRTAYGFTNVTLLTDAKATRAGILSALDSIRGRLSPDGKDDFIFFFSGHGDTWAEVNKSQDGTTNIVRHGFLVTYNAATNLPATLGELQAKHLDMTLLASNIVALPARHRLMFLDSCFSGLAFVEQAVVTNPPAEAYRDVIEHPTVQIMTAGLESERALEDPREGHGVFTEALLQQLASTNILTMEEVFFPLRVSVRRTLDDLNQPMSMSPQLRYLLYQNGTFLFVPLSQLATWARAKPDNSEYASLGAKGYFRPVTTNEIASLQTTAAQSPQTWQAEVDRYETRASMGDPGATIALAQIYGQGIGVKTNDARAKIYTAESHDYLTAGKTFDLFGAAGITNEATKQVLGGLLARYGPKDVFGRGDPKVKDVAFYTGLAVPLLTNAPAGNGVVGTVLGGVSSAGTAIKDTFNKIQVPNIFGSSAPDPVKGVADSQTAAKKALGARTVNLADAKTKLGAMLDELNKLAGTLPANTPPPAEMNLLKTAVLEAQTDLDRNLPAAAKTAIGKTDALIKSLDVKLKALLAAK